MIRGCQKRIIKIKNTGSGIFDEAYFILRDKPEKKGRPAETDMIKEANRIIRENQLSQPAPEGKYSRFSIGPLCFLLGAAVCALAFLAVYGLTLLF